MSETVSHTPVEIGSQPSFGSMLPEFDSPHYNDTPIEVCGVEPSTLTQRCDPSAAVNVAREPYLAPVSGGTYADNEFEVLAILDSEICEDSKVRYFIQYAPTDDYSADRDDMREWKVEKDLYCNTLIDAFHKVYPIKPIGKRAAARRRKRAQNIVVNENDENIDTDGEVEEAAIVVDPDFDMEQYPRLFPLLEQMPAQDEFDDIMLPLMLQIHMASRVLGRMIPMKRAPRAQRMQWNAVLDHFSTVFQPIITNFETQINDVTALAYLNAALDMAALPARFLAPIMGFKPTHGMFEVTVESHGTTPGQSFTLDMGPDALRTSAEKTVGTDFHTLSLDDADLADLAVHEVSCIIQANKLLHMDRAKTASNVLTGNGVATKNRCSTEILSKMHPPAPLLPLRLPPLRAPQISVAAEHCYELNQKAARVTETPLGFFGWSDDMFYWQAGRKATARKKFLFQRSRMQSILVECTAWHLQRSFI